MKDTNKIAFNIFGSYYKERRDKFARLRKDLIKARIYTPVERWLSSATLYSIIFAIPVAIVFLLLKVIMALKVDWSKARNLPEYIIHYKKYYTHPLKFEFSFGLIDSVLILAAILLTFFSVFFIFYFFPRIRAWEIGRKIDGHLPYAIGYISAMAIIGVVPYEIFKKLSEAEENYGEVSMEAKRVVRDVELFGFDFITALRNLASITPSVHLRTFVQGAVTTTLSGGEMGSYFVHKAKEYMEENRKRFTDFIMTLGMISELYITGLVAGPLFIIVMFTAMMMLSGASPVILMVIIYGMIPLGSIIFILLTDTLTPEGARV
jgi:flagellar protein FlaJ